MKLPDITSDTELYGEWYVLRAVKEQYNQEQAVDAVQAFWNRRSVTYEKEHEITSLEHWKNYLIWLVGENRSVKIIDLATGTGMIANLLGELGYTDVTGMDISEGMMDIARQRAKERRTGVSLRYGNALELDLGESTVDVLLSMIWKWWSGCAPV